MTECVTPLKRKEIIIISHIYDVRIASGWPRKKRCYLERALLIFLSFEDKEKQIDNDLLEIFVSAKLYSLVQHPSQTCLFPVWKQRLYKTVLIAVIKYTC